MRAFLVELLRDEGCAVVEACDGVEASRRLREDSRPWEYELVITDYQMPFFNGLDLVRSIRCDEVRPPVILMSAFMDDDLAARASLDGAVAVLAKPFSVDRLMALVRGLIGPL